MNKLFIAISIVLGALFFTYLSNGSYQEVAGVNSSDIVTLTNQERLAQGFKPLTISENLTKAAEAKAKDMVAEGYFDHISPKGLTPWVFIQKSGYQYCVAGENLAVGFLDPKQIVSSWMKSPSHRDNLLNKHFEEIGVAVVVGDYKGHSVYYIVQEFGKPNTLNKNCNLYD